MIKSYQIHKFHRKLRRTESDDDHHNKTPTTTTTTTWTSDVLIYIHSSSGIQTITILPLNDSTVLVGYPTRPFSCGEHLCGKRVQRRSRQLCRTCSGIPGWEQNQPPLYPSNRNKIAMATVTKTWLVIETGKLLHQCIYIFFQSNILI